MLYTSETRAMIDRQEEETTEKKVQQARLQLVPYEKTLLKEQNKTWKPIFTEFKQTIRKRNARLKKARRVYGAGWPCN